MRPPSVCNPDLIVVYVLVITPLRGYVAGLKARLGGLINCNIPIRGVIIVLSPVLLGGLMSSLETTCTCFINPQRHRCILKSSLKMAY